MIRGSKIDERLPDITSNGISSDIFLLKDFEYFWFPNLFILSLSDT